MSGHMYFADRYLGFDDAVYAAMRIPCRDEEKFKLVEEIEKQL